MAVALFASSAAPALASGVYFSTDFESDSTSITATLTGLAQQGPNDAAVAASTDHARNGSQAVKFNFNYADWSTLSTFDKRAEVLEPQGAFNRNLVLGQEYWFGFSQYIPTTWQDDLSTNSELIWQFHGSDTGPAEGPPPLAMYVSGGTSRISVRGATTTVYDQSVDPGEKKLAFFNFDNDKGKWVDYVINVVFNYSGGKLKVWRNGQLVVNYVGPTIYRSTGQLDESGPYFKIGVYKWAWGTTATQVTNRTLYADDISMGDSTAGCAGVAPIGSILCDTVSTIVGGTPTPTPTTSGVAPKVSPVTSYSTNVTPTLARATNKVKVDFTTSEAPRIVPFGTIAGRFATVLANGTGTGTSTATNWVAQLAMNSTDASGKVPFSIKVGNGSATATTTISSVTSGSQVLFYGQSPVVTLAGQGLVYLTNGATATYTDPGATATDVFGVSLPVTTSGSVDMFTDGTYLLTYSAKDAANNVGSTARTVIVTTDTSTTSTTTPTKTKGNSGGHKHAAVGDIVRELAFGASGGDVAALQEFLIDNGFTIPAGATGYFGTQTQTALIAYQNARGILPATGYFGSVTKLAMTSTGRTLAQNPAISATGAFTHNLVPGDVGEEVHELQVFLNAHDFTVAQAAAGAPGQETDYFGAATRDAVKRFQEAFANEILAPLGLSAPTGIVGSSTRAKLNSL